MHPSNGYASSGKLAVRPAVILTDTWAIAALWAQGVKCLMLGMEGVAFEDTPEVREILAALKSRQLKIDPCELAHWLIQLEVELAELEHGWPQRG